MSEILLPAGQSQIIQPLLKPGLNDCDNATYHADRAYLSSSVLKTLYKSLDDYYNEYVLGNKKEFGERTLAAFAEGSYLHSLILEPHTVADQYAFYQGWRKQGADWESFKAANEGKTILSLPQKERCDKLFAAYSDRPAALTLTSGGQAEQTICGILHDVPIKVRFDYIIPERGIIADVKTTGRSSDKDSFSLTVEDFSYELSASLYCQMAEQYYGRPFDFYFIVLSKLDGTCDVYRASSKSLQKGAQKIIRACSKFKAAKSTGVWTELSVEESTVSGGEYVIQEV